MLSLNHSDSSRAQPTLTPTQLADLETLAWISQREEDRNPPPPAKKKSTVNYQPQQAHPCETAFRHSHWKHRRAKVRAAMESAGTGQFALDRFDQCGSACRVEYSPSLKKERLAASYCHCRHCEPCMRAKANRIAANLHAKLEDRRKDQYRFITLTLKHTAQDLATQVRRLYVAFKKLRKSRAWSTSQTGGCAVLEVKWNPESRRWHPHLHVISDGNYIDKFTLSTAWKKATGDSTIVHIKILDDAKATAHYVAKYVTKGTNSEVWDDAQAANEWCCCTRGVRTCLTYGTWRGFALTRPKVDATDWLPITTLIEICAAADRHEQWALETLCRLNAKRLAPEKCKKPPDPRLFA